MQTTGVLQRNLAALAKTSAAAAQAIARAPARPDLVFDVAPDGGVTASEGGPAAHGRRALASRRGPLDEARRLAETVDLREAAAVAIAGFGLGHHVAELSRRMGNTGVIVVFEPDVALLRAVLERVDCSAWLSAGNVAVLTDADDAGAMSACVTGVEGVFAMGLALLDHPASVARLGELRGRFYDNFRRIIEALRMAVVTTLYNMGRTFRNAVLSADRYALCPGVAELAGVGKGRTGIVIAAGPSLARAMPLLARPGVRDRFVLVAVQTVLKPLLAAGIRPHFVTALDYHEISGRFYEGLSEDDVCGVTLIAQPIVNPAVLEAWPGELRLVGDQVLDALLGPELAGIKGTLPRGATVAHLAYYLARHVGCDPVVLVGQDLGFTDGQYYAAGAAIHGVWGGELNEFLTLETLEWQRIRRMGERLRRITDTLGRSMLTDEQMQMYLVQFEREFAADARRGLTTLDASEGGAAKRGAAPVSLEEIIEGGRERDGMDPVRIPTAPAAADATLRLARLSRRVREVRQGVWKVGQASREARGLLARMLDDHADQRGVNELIDAVYKLRAEATGTEPAFPLVNHLNQRGGFDRLRRDRMLAVDPPADPMEQQRAQIERDIENVESLAGASDDLGSILDEAVKVFEGDLPKRSRGDALAPSSGAPARSGALRSAAIVVYDSRRRGLAGARPDEPVKLLGRTALRLTIERMARCREIDRIVVLADDPARARREAGAGAGTFRVGRAGVEVVPDAHPIEPDRARAIASSRLFARESWRGSPGGLAVFDEVVHGPSIAAVMRAQNLDAAVVVGGDWPAVDPELCDRVMVRLREDQGARGFAFSLALPGLAGIALSRDRAALLAAASPAGLEGSIGAMLGYHAEVAKAHLDPASGSLCEQAAGDARDAGVRLVADTHDGIAALEAAARALGERFFDAPGGDVAGAASRGAATCTRLVIDPTGHAGGGGADGIAGTSADVAAGIIEQAVGLWPNVCVTIGRGGMCGGGGTECWGGDPLCHPEWRAIVSHAAARANTHVRTAAAIDEDAADALIRAGVGAVSIDLLADTAATYHALTGSRGFDAVRAGVERLISRRGASGGYPRLWVVPRITRCDGVYEEIEPFYDRWMRAAGWAVIDPLPVSREGERIGPLPPPASVARRLDRSTLVVRADGSAWSRWGASLGDTSHEHIGDVWARRRDEGDAALEEAGDGAAAIVTAGSAA